MFDAFHSEITLHYRPRNRNTYITITHTAEVCVRTPIKDIQKIRTLLKEREQWIRAKILAVSARNIPSHKLGETIRFRGEIYSLEQLPSLHEKVQKTAITDAIQRHYYNFYKNEAQITIPSRVMHYARKMGLNPSEIKFKRMRRRWGSCDTKGRVTFNTMMMQLSYEQIDYIIVHELAHLRHMNHSAMFHALVKEYLPHEKRLRNELRGMQPL